MTKLVRSLQQLLDAQRLGLETAGEVSALMRWLSFIAVAMISHPTAFEQIYEAEFVSDAEAGATPWVDAQEALMDYETNIGLVCQMVYCRIVDRFLSYLAMLAECVYEHDYSLLPDAKLRLSEVLAFGSLDGLIREQAGQAAFELTFSAPRLVDATFALAGIEPSSVEHLRQKLDDAIEIRNSFIHRSGLIDQRFVERRPDFPGQLGEPIVVSADEVTSAYDLVGELRDLLKSGVESSHGITLDMLRQAFEASESEHAGRADVSG